jgi:cytosine/adenosine deaminase-related metal-dependent hydrolase
MMDHFAGSQPRSVAVYGGRCVLGPQETTYASIQIADGRVTRILSDLSSLSIASPDCAEIDLSGFLVMPGLVNAHDHLEFALYPRLARPPYRSYIDWGTDILSEFSDVIAKHRSIPKEVRLWWGGIRNLLCGVTTVSHHNPLWPELQREDFPVRVVEQYGWGHSLAFGGDLRVARAATPAGCAFIVHACEGVDEKAREELWELDRLGLLDERAVLVHGLAIDRSGVELMQQRRASLIVCPSSNDFLFGKLPDLSLLGDIDNVALGNDSPLTAEGDLLDEVRFAMRCCNLSSQTAYRMVTETPAAILRLREAEGTIRVSGRGDLMAVRDTNRDAADRLQMLSLHDVEFVMLGGCVQLASEKVYERLPLPVKKGMEPLWIDGTMRWLRAPVKELLSAAEEVLGVDGVCLGGRSIRIPARMEAGHVYSNSH